MLAGAVGATGAGAQMARLKVPAASAVNSGAPYTDYLLWPGDGGAVLYVGQFRDRVPHGEGRLFWRDTQHEAFIGSFEDGLPVTGTFISRHEVAITRCHRKAPTDPWQVHRCGPGRLFGGWGRRGRRGPPQSAQGNGVSEGVAVPVRGPCPFRVCKRASSLPAR